MLKDKITLAFKLFDSGEYQKSEKIYSECLNEISDKTSNEYKKILNGMGYVKSFLNKFSEARTIYNELLKIAIEMGDVEEEAIAIHQLGMVERMAKNYDDALALFDKELKLLSKNKLDNELSLSANYYEQGYIHFLMNENETAEMIMNQSLKYAKLADDKICIGCAYRGLGEIFMSNKKKKQANELFNKAIIVFKEANDLVAVTEIESLMKK